MFSCDFLNGLVTLSVSNDYFTLQAREIYSHFVQSLNNFDVNSENCESKISVDPPRPNRIVLPVLQNVLN